MSASVIRRIKSMLAAVSAGGLMLNLAACGTAGPAGLATSQAVINTTPTAATTTSSSVLTSASSALVSKTQEAAGPTTAFVASVKDKDGYQFDISVNLATADLGGTVEFDKPGFMSAYFSLSVLDMTLVNKTPSRAVTFESVSGVTAPLNQPKFLLSAFYGPDSPVCSGDVVNPSFYAAPWD